MRVNIDCRYTPADVLARRGVGGGAQVVFATLQTAFALAVFCLVQAQRPPLPWPYPLTAESFISFSAPPPSPSLPPEILTWETVTERDRS